MFVENHVDQNEVFTQEFDGINSCVDCNGAPFVLLVTKAHDKPFCAFYVTDGYQDFWLARYQVSYFTESVAQMGIETDIVNTLKCMADGLRRKCNLIITENNEAMLETRLILDDTITLKHIYKLTVNIHYHINEMQFRTCNKAFLKLLFDAKEKQVQMVRREFQSKQKRKMEDQEKQKELNEKYLHNVLKTEPQKKPNKNRNLMYPGMTMPKPNVYAFETQGPNSQKKEKQMFLF